MCLLCIYSCWCAQPRYIRSYGTVEAAVRSHYVEGAGESRACTFWRFAQQFAERIPAGAPVHALMMAHYCHHPVISGHEGDFPERLKLLTPVCAFMERLSHGSSF